jgi:hypothetical protein
MTASLQMLARITAPSNSPAPTLAGAGPARPANVDLHNDAPPEDFHAVMERQSAERAESAHAPHGPTGNRASSTKPKTDAPSKEADPASTAVSTTDSSTPEPDAKAQPVPAASITFLANFLADLSSDKQLNAPLSKDDDSSESLATTEDGSSGGDGTQAFPGSSSGTTNAGPQTNLPSTLVLNLGIAASVARGQHQGLATPQEAASAATGGVLPLNTSASELAGASEGVKADATQSAAASTPASSQANTTDDGKLDSAGHRIEVATSTSPSTPDALAFEAKLTPAPNSTAAPGNFQQSLSQSSQSGDQPGSKASQVSSAAWSSAEAAVEPAPSPSKTQALFEAGAISTATPAPIASHTDTRSTATAAPTETSAVERMQSLIEAPAQASSPHSITVKVAGETGDASIDLRFIDRGGDIHLSVRTPSAEVAQELRGGLSDLVGRLEHAGIRAEISNTSTSGSALGDPSKDQEQGASDRRGSGRNQADPESQQQDSRGSNRFRWLEALETSTNFSKEQNI